MGRACAYVRAMGAGEEQPNLAPAYQLALDLEAEGLTGEELAERLGVTSAALPSLLQVAHAKAAALTQRSLRPTPGGPLNSGDADRA